MAIMATEDIVSRIQLLEDITEIKELTARYAWHVARAEVRDMASLFTEDGCFESASGIMRGARQILDFYQQHLRTDGTIPLVSNHIIKVTGDTAEGSCKMSSPWQNAGPGFCGYYRDSYRRQPEGWRFSHRRWHYHDQPAAAPHAG